MNYLSYIPRVLVEADTDKVNNVGMLKFRHDQRFH